MPTTSIDITLDLAITYTVTCRPTSATLTDLATHWEFDITSLSYWNTYHRKEQDIKGDLFHQLCTAFSTQLHAAMIEAEEELI